MYIVLATLLAGTIGFFIPYFVPTFPAWSIISISVGGIIGIIGGALQVIHNDRGL